MVRRRAPHLGRSGSEGYFGQVSTRGSDRTGLGLPVASPINLDGTTASCEILDLVLGPLDLDLLGLVVTLDTVHLNITAEQGPGNLLGNLLCAVAGLLDGGSTSTALHAC